ncbi:MAG: glycerophosphodiester phosphodiesterase [Rubrivivax sp.]|jgi:glycerophosphoryl diester phosphodiesterase
MTAWNRAVRLRRLGSILGAGMLLTAALHPAWAFDLQGHRGARGLAPENSLPGFQRALAVGVTTLELDVGLTRDGVLVIHHDRRLNADLTRGPDGQWLSPAPTGAAASGVAPASPPPLPTLHSLDFTDLARYDVGRIRPGTRYAAQYPAQVGEDGVRIPRLQDLFALLQARGLTSAVRLNIETKLSSLAPEETASPEVMARALIAAVRAAGLTARTTVQSFDWRTLQVVQREAPELATAYLSAQQPWLDNIGAGTSGPSPWTAGVAWAAHGSVPKMVHAAGGRLWSPFHGDLTPALLDEARRLGLKVLPWTVNDPAQMTRLVEWGVDGLITDRPDLLREVLQRLGRPVPPPR